MVSEIFRGPTSTPPADPDEDLEAAHEAGEPDSLFDADGVFLPEGADDGVERVRLEDDEDFDHEENPRTALKRRRAAQRRRQRDGAG